MKSIQTSTDDPVRRQRFVVDPVWRVVDISAYDLAWNALLQEASQYAFVGLDLEWSTTEKEQSQEEGVDDTLSTGSIDLPSHPRSQRKRRTTGPVATVQLSTRSSSFVVKLCDLWTLVKDPSGCQDPCLPLSLHWPRHREGVKKNSADLLARILSDVGSLLQNDSIAKVGVGISGDACKLQKDYPEMLIHPWVELFPLANQYLPDTFQANSLERLNAVALGEARSLRDLCKLCCGYSLDKDIFVILSDWGGSLGALSSLQVCYAACDAEASFDICECILSTHCDSQNGVLRDTPGDRANRRALEPLFLTKPSGSNSGTNRQHDPERKELRETRCMEPLPSGEDLQSHSSEPVNVGWCKGRAKPYYDNINVFDSNMNLVFTVDKAKAEWYVYKKHLAVVTEWRSGDDGELTEGNSAGNRDESREIAAIQLSFTPDFRKFNDAHIRRNLEYFQQPKDNACVVCGAGGSLVRFAVVPMLYRKYFPSVYMSHNSYDLLLLCTHCFARSRGVYEVERRRTARDFGIPLSHLTPKQLALYRKEIEALEATLTTEGHTEGDSAEHGMPEDDLVAHHLPLDLKLRVMKEFAELERHREILLSIFKYAKALRMHYEAAHSDQTELSPRRRPALIPQTKVDMMRSYIDEFAACYLFADEVGTNGAGQTVAVSPIDGYSSFAGVRLILDGGKSSCKNAKSSSSMVDDEADDSPKETSISRMRMILSTYWLRVNPSLLPYVPQTTRIEESGDPPLVDSHGFFVVRMLMEKYSALHGDKTGEHAVGQFIYRWREAFLNGLHPGHLPVGWVAEDGILR